MERHGLTMTEAKAREVKRRYSRDLLALDEVSGVGVTRPDPARKSTGSEDDYVLAVFLATAETPSLRDKIADVLGGHEFVTVYSGQFRLHTATGTTH